MGCTLEKRTSPPVVKRPRTHQNPGNENESNEYEKLDDDERYPLRFVTVESATFGIMPEVDPTTDDIVSEHDTAEHTLSLPEPCTTETEVWAPLEVREEALTTNSTCHDHDNSEMLGGNLTDRSDFPVGDVTYPVLSRVPAGEVELLSPEKRDYASQNDPKRYEMAN